MFFIIFFVLYNILCSVLYSLFCIIFCVLCFDTKQKTRLDDDKRFNTTSVLTFTPRKHFYLNFFFKYEKSFLPNTKLEKYLFILFLNLYKASRMYDLNTNNLITNILNTIKKMFISPNCIKYYFTR